MATPVLMPKQGNTVEECVLVAWKKQKGDSISSGEVVAEIETDKAVFEIESPATGTLLETYFKEGDVVPVFTNIGVIGKPGEKTDEFKPAPKAAAPKKAEPAAAPAISAPATPAASSAPAVESAPAPKAAAPVSSMLQASEAPKEKVLSKRAKKYLESHPVNVSLVQGSGPNGRVVEADLRDAWLTKPRLSPLAAKMVNEEGYIAPEQGSGVNGMILEEDLGAPPVALSNIRVKIAEKMHLSLADTAQLTIHTSAQATGLLAFRKKIKANMDKPGMADVNLNDMVVFATVKTLMEYPDVNAEFINGKIHHHRNVDIAVAVDTPRGLMVPVIKKAQDLSMAELATKTKTFAAQAKEGKVSPDDLNGGSFTISNLGGMGIESFTPIINYPQTAILGVCNIQLKPVRVNGKVEFVDYMGLSLTVNHQVLDGAPGARFMYDLKQKIENIEEISDLPL